jgi:hypothetical protein
MSNIDDVLEVAAWSKIPNRPLFAIVFVLAFLALFVLAIAADAEGERKCAEHGERLVDAKDGYVVCATPNGGKIVR